MEVSDPAEEAILGLLSGRRKSIAPADAARVLAGEASGEAWRRQISPIRLAYMRLAKAGRIEILRKGRKVAPAEARGVVRLRLAAPE